MEEYLRGKCDVESTESASCARELLDVRRFDAIVVADDLPGGGADDLEQRARSSNPGLAAVRTVTDLSSSHHPPGSARLLEKPFDLLTLGRMLGLEDA